MSQDFIRIDNAYFSYEESSGEQKQILNNLNLSIKRGEFVALIGHNGCGKSTLAKLLNALYIPEKGKVFIDGMDTADDNLKFDIRKKVGLIFQNPDNQLVASIVEEDVAFGPENLGMSPSKIRERVDEALKAVDMYDFRSASPHKLSGGQKQRIAIAGVIAMKPDCIVLDEPTSMLDPKGRQEVMDTIKKLNKEKNITIILITHYMDEAVKADRIIVIDSGQAIATGTPREIFTDVNFLNRHSLAVPQATELAYALKAKGYSLPDGILDEYECIVALEQLLEEYKCH